jgi:hypothetical protein
MSHFKVLLLHKYTKNKNRLVISSEVKKRSSVKLILLGLSGAFVISSEVEKSTRSGGLFTSIFADYSKRIFAAIPNAK